MDKVEPGALEPHLIRDVEAELLAIQKMCRRASVRPGELRVPNADVFASLVWLFIARLPMRELIQQFRLEMCQCGRQ